MKLLTYTAAGDYYRAQIRGAADHKKPWARRENLAVMAALIRSAHPDVRGLGICHGCNSGEEISYFKEYLPGWEVVGTDVVGGRGVKVWDFHVPMAEYRGRSGFVYSNALDHAHAPKAALLAWLEALDQGGLCLIEWSTHHAHPATQRDPFSATPEELHELLQAWAPAWKVKTVDLPVCPKKGGRSMVEVVSRG